MSRLTGLRRAARKYARVQSVFIQSALTYRVESAVWFLFDLLPPLTMVYLWMSAFRDQSTIAGYSLPALVAYYVIVLNLRTFLTPYVEYEIQTEVQEGRISQHLVRPLNIWVFYFLMDIGYRLVRISFLIPVVLVVILLFGSALSDLSITPGRIAAFLVSAGLALITIYFIKLTLGWITFWLTEAWGLFELFELILLVFGGLMIPLEMLPGPAQAVAAVLPFQYLYYFPANVLIGRVDGPALGLGLATQAGWLVATGLFARWLWGRALRRYEAYGG